MARIELQEEIEHGRKEIQKVFIIKSESLETTELQYSEKFRLILLYLTHRQPFISPILCVMVQPPHGPSQEYEEKNNSFPLIVKLTTPMVKQLWISLPLWFFSLSAKLLQQCLTLCNALHCSLTGSCVHGILQKRILQCIAMPSSKESSQLRDGTHVSYVSCLGRQVLYTGATWETKKKKKSIKLITYYTVYATLLGTSLVAQMVKNEPAMQETQV